MESLHDARVLPLIKITTTMCTRDKMMKRLNITIMIVASSVTKMISVKFMNISYRL